MEEMLKRKREGIERSREGEEDIFRDSKKTSRSPIKAGAEEKVEEDLRKMMREMKVDSKCYWRR